ncbi:MAG: phosphoribosylformylglycinamidine synthase I [bacterium]
MKVVVVIFPGSNCDRDCLHVLREVMGVRAEAVWYKNALPRGTRVAILPGGFSFGDYLRCGALAKASVAMRSVGELARRGGHVLGICNGFQLLVEAGLLPGALRKNDCLQFRCEDVWMKVERGDTVFTSAVGKSVIRLPIAHGEGNYYAPGETLRELEERRQVVFRYCDASGNTTKEANPNGSQNNIAGIINREGNVLGMMPHPERASEAICGNVDGLAIFESLLGGVGAEGRQMGLIGPI